MKDYTELKRRVEAENKLPLGILDFLIKQESGGKSNAVSNKGAAGIMQLMPGTAKELGLSESDRFDPEKAIPAGGKYLGQQLLRFGSLPLALAAYNSGPERVAKAGTIPNIPETQDYVANIMHGFNQTQQQPMQIPAPPSVVPVSDQQMAVPQILQPTISGNVAAQQVPGQQPMPQMPQAPQLSGLDQFASTLSQLKSMGGKGGQWVPFANYGMEAGLGADKPQLRQQDAFEVMPSLISLLVSGKLGGQQSRKRVI